MCYYRSMDMKFHSYELANQRPATIQWLGSFGCVVETSKPEDRDW